MIKKYSNLIIINMMCLYRMSSAFMLSAIREIYESGSAGFVSSLLSSVENYINLQCRDLDSVHCAALRFTLQHCTAASLNLLWTSIPEEELESILPLFTHLSHLRSHCFPLDLYYSVFLSQVYCVLQSVAFWVMSTTSLEVAFNYV